MHPKRLLINIKEQIFKILKVIGIIQTAILLSLFYFFMLGPIALIYQAIKALNKRPKKLNSYWIKKEYIKPTEENLSKQY